MKFFWCDMCKCYGCLYRGSCAEQMIDVCVEESVTLRVECEKWRDKDGETTK